MIVLLSGPIAVGKSTVARHLADALGSTPTSVRDALHEMLGATELTRAELQRLGADLDKRTQGRWLVDYIEQHQTTVTVVDSMRTIRQTLPLLDHFTDSRLVYLTAHESTRRQRYQSAAISDSLKRATAFDSAMAHQTETDVSRLASLAHLSLETDELSAVQVAEAIREFL